MLRIEVLQELELAVTDGEEGHPQPADDAGGAAVMDDAVTVRREALDRDDGLDIGLRALER